MRGARVREPPEARRLRVLPPDEGAGGHDGPGGPGLAGGSMRFTRQALYVCEGMFDIHILFYIILLVIITS
jgi:hypothetical protein